MELIKVSQNAEGQSVVSARDLHAFLEATERFSNWCSRMFAHGFIENQDFTSVKNFTLVNNGAKREMQDYALTIDCAREISMLQRNDKGKQARQYFLECEKQLKAIQQNLVTQSEFLAFRKLVSLNIAAAEKYVLDLEDRIEILEANQIQDKTTLTDTTQRVDKIEDYLDFKAIACVYVMFCPHRKLHKFGSSHDAKGRKKQFSVVYANLEIVYEIPTISRDEAYTLENAVKKRFKKKHVEGEWYALESEDLEYLYEQQQNNKKHLANMA